MYEDIYLLCFAVGALWSFAALLLGRIHAGNFGHSHIGHSHEGRQGMYGPVAAHQLEPNISNTARRRLFIC